MRVRHHELGGQAQVSSLESKVTAPPVTATGSNGLAGSDFRLKTHLARIEVGAAELPRLLAAETAARVATALKQIGYTHVTLDLQGYRRGSLNETSVSRAASAPQPVGAA